MRTCDNCGAQFKDDELFCPVCGQEVQLVPDYVTIESHYQESELKREEEEREKQEEQERREIIEERRRQMHRNIVITVCLVIAAIAAVICFVLAARANRNAGSYDYQYEHAVSAYEQEHYEDALEYVSQALSLNQTDEAKYLEAQIRLGLGDTDAAESVLLALIEDNPNYTASYDLLISIYEKSNAYDKIEQLLANCQNTTVLEKYSDYLADTPTISPEGGSYDETTQVTISSRSKGTIYYTLDGSDPGTSSDKYTAPFELGEGTTTVKAVIITKNGLISDIAEADFEIQFETPDAPKITPRSGTYKREIEVDSTGEEVDAESSDEEEEGVITVEVPDGYTCYYSFDSIPTNKSTKYTKPVKMRTGEHVFYAVLESKEGKIGKIASATYVYSEVTITPTPTPTATPTPASQNASSTYNPSQTYDPETIVTPTPTPTEEPSPTPTASPTVQPTPTETSDDSNSGSESGES